MWRAEDQALLRRLEDERATEQLFAALTHDHAPPPHPRASGLLAALRAMPGGEDAIAACLDGDPRTLIARTRPERYAELDPVLVHHLALLHERVAAHLDVEGAPREVLSATLHALAAWRVLAHERAYLDALALAVADEGDEAFARQAVRDAIDAPLRRLVDRGRPGVVARTAEAQLALRVLDRIPRVLALTGLPDDAPAAIELRTRARALRLELLDVGFEALRQQLDEDKARGEPGATTNEIFAVGVAFWRWADEADEVARFLIDHALRVSWDLYNARRWQPLGQLCRVLEPPVDACVRAIEGDKLANLAYTARAAQMLVFRSEMEPHLPRQIAIAERAIALCPTHRNGKLVLADLLALRALRTLRNIPLIGGQRLLQEAHGDALRARELWPDTPRLVELSDRLRQKGHPLPPEAST